MDKQLVPIEPLSIPDLRRPTAMPSLPAWLAGQRSALAENLQPVDGSFRDVMTLPEERMPTANQKVVLYEHLRELDSCLRQTAEHGDQWAAEIMVTVTKLILTLGGNKATAESAQAKAEAYEFALDDVPSWAVVAAARRWYRGDCGAEYNYAFPPDPAALRKLAVSETFRVRNRITEIEKILNARLYIDCTKQLEDGRAAWRGMMQGFIKGGDVLKELTFAKAVELGSNAGEGEV